jgi:hypothetical protein
MGSGKLGLRPWSEGQPNEGLRQLGLWSRERCQPLRQSWQLGVRSWSISQSEEGLRQLGLWSRESCGPLITESDNYLLRQRVFPVAAVLWRAGVTEIVVKGTR